MAGKTFVLGINFLLITMLFISCKKEDLGSDESQVQSYGNLIPKIKIWLDEQKKDLPATSVAIIDSLNANVEYGNIRLEKYRNSEELIVVPVSEKFKSKNNDGKNPVNYLVLVLKNQDSITNGNIIQYISSEEQKKAPQNTFSKIFTYKILDCSGQFTILSITDYFRYELKFSQGKLESVAEQKRRESANNTSGRVNSCIDWYLITTVYYYDGSTSTYEEFLGTTCNGDPECNTTRIANGRSYRTNCGGGGGNPIDYEYEKRKFFKWVVVSGGVGGAYVESWEYIRGRASTSSQWPDGGYFISISHNTSNCNCPQNSVWGELSGTAVSLLGNGVFVKSNVRGAYTYQGIQNIYENYITLRYSDVF